MPRSEFSKRTKDEAFKRCGGFCENPECGARLTVGKFQYDHIVACAFGGDNSLDNCQVICSACHVAKTRGDNREAKKANRVHAKHIGAASPKQTIKGRGFRKADPQRSASRPLTKTVNRIER